MCNYYSRRRDPSRLVIDLHVKGELPNMEPRYVVRPTNTERVVAVGQDGERHLVPMRWGLVPPWAPDVKTGLTMFNARSETIPVKASFKSPFTKGRRCLVPVDGFFEFSGEKGHKQPWYIKPRDDRLMTFAGLWESWRGPKGDPLLSYTIATTEPNAVLASIHDRMPVLLTEPAQWDLWLDPKADLAEVTAFLRPAPDDLLEAIPVTRELLKIKDPGPEILAPVQLA